MCVASQPGFFISFEGSEGCGKSTQIARLVEALKEDGHEPLLLREPGGTAIGEHIRHLLQHCPDGRAMVPETELLLFAASRAQLVRQTILPALEAGRVVISDRFLDSTTVYQGVARQIAAEKVAMINRFAAGPRLPDITVLLDMDSTEALARVNQRPDAQKKPDRMEEEPLAFYESVRRGYLAAAQGEPERFCVLDASQSADTIASAIQSALQSRGFFQRISV